MERLGRGVVAVRREDGSVFVSWRLLGTDAQTVAFFRTHHLIWTTVFAALGVARFLRLVTARPHAESPTEEMLRDRWFLLNVLAWAVTVVTIIYVSG